MNKQDPKHTTLPNTEEQPDLGRRHTMQLFAAVTALGTGLGVHLSTALATGISTTPPRPGMMQEQQPQNTEGKPAKPKQHRPGATQAKPIPARPGATQAKPVPANRGSSQMKISPGSMQGKVHQARPGASEIKLQGVSPQQQGAGMAPGADFAKHDKNPAAGASQLKGEVPTR